MPIYRYHCTACGADTQVLAKMSDPAPETCPKCGEATLVKGLSRTSFKLAGGGWYADGYGASGGVGTAGSSSSSSGGGTSGDSGGSSGGSSGGDA